MEPKPPSRSRGAGRAGAGEADGGARRPRRRRLRARELRHPGGGCSSRRRSHRQRRNDEQRQLPRGSRLRRARVDRAGGACRCAARRPQPGRAGRSICRFRTTPRRGSFSEIGIGKKGTVRDVNVAVRISHARREPAQPVPVQAVRSTYALATGVGGTRNDLGSGQQPDCTGAMTVFDGAANSTLMSDRRAPFDGAYRPQGSLPLFDRDQVKVRGGCSSSQTPRARSGTGRQ